MRIVAGGMGITGALTLGGIALAIGAARCDARAADVPAPRVARPVAVAGIENLFRVHDRLYSGGGPEGDEAFAGLRQLGVRTIVSVDGAPPDIERARKFGLRYVHIPLGYAGIDVSRQRLLVKAVRESTGPLYVHCHHGRHRGPAAAAVVWRALDPACSPALSLDWLRQAGTDPRYRGLWEAVRGLELPDAAALADPQLQLVEAVAPEAWTAAMVRMDALADLLKKAQQEGQDTRRDEAARAALLLEEAFREAERRATSENRPRDFQRWMTAGREDAAELERQLRAAPAREKTAVAAQRRSQTEAWKRVTAACADCHAAYRDN